MTRSRIRGTRSSIFPPHSLEDPPYSRVIEVHNSASITHKRPIYGRWSCSPATGNIELTFMIRKFVVLTRTCCSTSNSVGDYGWPKFVRIKNGRMASRDLRVGWEAGHQHHRPRLSVAVGSCLLCVCRLSVGRLTALTQECHPPLQAPAELFTHGAGMSIRTTVQGRVRCRVVHVSSSLSPPSLSWTKGGTMRLTWSL